MQKLYPCSRCGKVHTDPNLMWRIKYDDFTADENNLGNQRVLCTSCCIRFQEVFMNEKTNADNKKTLDTFFSQF